MYSKKATVVSPLGLYARSAASFIQLANRFKSVIFLEYEERKANAKSLLGVLSLALSQNSEVLITAEGVDEEEAGNTLAKYISSGCPESYEDDEPVPADSTKKTVTGAVPGEPK